MGKRRGLKTGKGDFVVAEGFGGPVEETESALPKADKEVKAKAKPVAEQKVITIIRAKGQPDEVTVSHRPAVEPIKATMKLCPESISVPKRHVKRSKRSVKGMRTKTMR